MAVLTRRLPSEHPVASVLLRPPEEWDTIVSKLGGNHFHARDWILHRATSTRAQPVFLIGYDIDKGPIAAAAGLILQPASKVLSKVRRRLIMESHPLVADGAKQATGFLEQIVREARSLGCVTFELQSYFSGQSPIQPGLLGFTLIPRVEFLVSLRRPLDEIWKGISREQREKIRRAEKRNVCVEPTNSAGSYRDLMVLQRQTRLRRADRGERYDLEAGEEYYGRLAANLGEVGLTMLFLAKLDGEPISAILFGTYNQRAYSIYSGSNRKGYELSAPSLTFWRALQWFHERAYCYVNRGGVPLAYKSPDHPQHGIYFYKSRLGTEETICLGGNLDTRPRLAALGRSLATVRQAGFRVLSGMPMKRRPQDVAESAAGNRKRN